MFPHARPVGRSDRRSKGFSATVSQRALRSLLAMAESLDHDGINPHRKKDRKRPPSPARTVATDCVGTMLERASSRGASSRWKRSASSLPAANKANRPHIDALSSVRWTDAGCIGIPRSRLDGAEDLRHDPDRKPFLALAFLPQAVVALTTQLAGWPHSLPVRPCPGLVI
jgi:hypothetical protein